MVKQEHFLPPSGVGSENHEEHRGTQELNNNPLSTYVVLFTLFYTGYAHAACFNRSEMRDILMSESPVYTMTVGQRYQEENERTDGYILGA